MSEPEDRKSMDDVLASIRQIVRSEKEPGQDDAPEIFDADAAEGPAVTVEEDVPLALTSAMRMDEASAADAETQAESSAVPPIPASDIEQTAGLRDLVRDVLLEELAGPKGSDIIRSVLKDELVSGETGVNMSTNVLALIQSEVSKAMKS